MSKTVKVITVEKDVLRKNNEIAASNQAMFARAGVTVINLLSSPGSGKTSLLEYLVPRLMRRFPVYVIEGDVDTPRARSALWPPALRWCR